MGAAAMPSEMHRRQRRKNLAVGGAVAFAMLLFFVITVVRMGLK